MTQHDRRYPDALRVRHGRWTFSLHGEEVADICYDGSTLLRGIRPVVRDQDWNTLVAEPAELRVESRDGSWLAELSVTFRRGELGYLGSWTSQCRETLSVTFTGTALGAFRRNRIGLVVLHPGSDAGRDVVKLAPDGSTRPDRWPEQVSPHQPFRDVHGFHWTRDDVAAQLVLDGDVFETEDQRNWTDASFKTYSTPLDRPFPVDVRAGEQVRQSARLTVSTAAAPRAREPDAHPEPVVVTDVEVGVVPAIATSLPQQQGGSLEPAGYVEKAGSLGRTGDSPSRWAALLVEVTGPVDTWPAQLDRAATTAARNGVPLDVRLVTDDPESIRTALAHPAGRDAVRLAVFDPVLHVTTPPLWRALTLATEESGSPAALVAGARSHFAELNRQRDLLPADATALTFSLTPQMHAFEVSHLVDSLVGQRSVVRSALALAGGRPLHIGPITLRQRFNAVATSAEAPTEPPDPLQSTPFTAAWTLGSVAALTTPGVESLTYYELEGPGGLGSAAGPYPVGELLSWLAAAAGRRVLHADAPVGITAYAVARDTSVGIDVLVANLTDRHRTIRLHDGRPYGQRPPTVGPGSGGLGSGSDQERSDQDGPVRERSDQPADLGDPVLLEPWSVSRLRLGLLNTREGN